MKKSDHPYIIVCSGMTMDGKLSNHKKEQIQIDESGSIDMLLEARAEVDAVVVGGNTLIQDDPGLTVKKEKYRQLRRRKGKPEEPAKVAIVSNLKKVKENGEFFSVGSNDIHIFTSEESSKNNIEKLRKVSKVHICGKTQVNLMLTMKTLMGLGFEKLVVEGGGELNYSMFNNGIVDEVRLKIGNLIAGGRNSITFIEGKGFSRDNMPAINIEKIFKGKDHVIIIGKVK